jgi:hypothetical protein
MRRLEERVRELERHLGRKTLEVEILIVGARVVRAGFIALISTGAVGEPQPAWMTA